VSSPCTAHSIKEFIDYAKSRPGKLTIASPGTGSAPFLAEMLFLQMTDRCMRSPAFAAANWAYPGLPRRLPEAPVKITVPRPRGMSRRAASR
jgi:tripartite-type tricarboxylate transporter receptor subunit TctC